MKILSFLGNKSLNFLSIFSNSIDFPTPFILSWPPTLTPTFRLSCIYSSCNNGHYDGLYFQRNEDLGVKQEIMLMMSTNSETERNRKTIERPLSSWDSINPEVQGYTLSTL